VCGNREVQEGGRMQQHTGRPGSEKQYGLFPLKKKKKKGVYNLKVIGPSLQS
jgi:hypothetical protein